MTFNRILPPRWIAGLGFALAVALTAAAQVTVPYTTDFDTGFGFSPGSLNGQQNWLVLGGSANITTTPAPLLGTQSVVMIPGSPAALIGLPLATPVPLDPVMYADCLVKPVASSSVSSFIDLDASLAIFIKNGTQGQIYAFSGTSWIPTPAVFSLGTDGASSANWMRLTFREDFTAKTWDLYYNGAFAAHDVAFVDPSATTLPFFIAEGDPTTSGYLNYLSVSGVNPLFTDANNDGIPDAWESQYGLSLTANGRNLQLAGNGTTVLQDYIAGTSPYDYYSGVLPTLTSQIASNGEPGAQGLVSVLVTNTSTGAPLANAPITLSVTGSSAQIAATPGGLASTSVSVMTNSSGIASGYITFTTLASDTLTATANAVAAHTGTPLSTSISIPINPPGSSSLCLWLRADTGVTATNGKISAWADQSSKGNIATGTASLAMKATNVAQTNRVPVVDFNGAQSLALTNVMEIPATGQESQQGEIFAVVRSGVAAGAYGNLWAWGTGASNLYPNTNGTIADDFGSTAVTTIGMPPQNIQQFHIYNISSSPSEWTQRFDGLVNYDRLGNSVGFPKAPVLSAGPNYLIGDIAEVIVYNQVLSQAQRDAVCAYLGNKYGLYTVPQTPANPFAIPLAPDQVSVQWAEPLNGSHVEYLIKRSTDGVTFTQVASVADALTYIDTAATGLAGGQRYYYQVQALSYAGASAVSQTTAAVTTPLTGTGMPLGSIVGQPAMVLWLKGDAGLSAISAINPGNGLDFWGDQSGNTNDGTQATVARPTLEMEATNLAQSNSLPVVHFNESQGAQYIQLPNVMENPSTGQEAQQGEIFAVVRSGNTSFYNDLWTWGTAGSNLYPNDDGTISDDFGSARLTNTGVPAQNIQQFHVYNISSSASEWTQRFDGLVNYDRLSNTVGFATAPMLSAPGDYFFGDIAEVIVYNQVLNQPQRDAVYRYLGNKYGLYNIPATPTGLAATPLSPDQISLQWLAPLNGSHVEYLVGRSTDGVNFAPVASVADALSYIDTGLNPATTYYYQIQAQGYAGLSAPFPGSGYPSVSATTLLNGGAADMPLNMRLWLKADAGLEVTASGDGIDFWGDQSGNANDATQNIASNRPTLVTSQLNGFPAVHFNRNQGAQSFNLPNVMGNPSAPGQQAQAGEIFAVVRSDNNPFPNNLWTWGTSGSALYPNDDGTIADGFGSTTLTNTGIPPVNIQQFHLYNISSSSAEWTQRFDGVVNYDAVGNAVGFRTAPTLGGGGSNFLGDIAEIIVYNYVLSPQQRETVGFYLNSKYAFAPGRPIAFDTYRDGNYDGLPDGLDRQLGFNPASLDVDNDGDTNLQDILEGLDPLDPNSMPPPPPPPDPGEPAPTITLTAPTGAVSQN